MNDTNPVKEIRDIELTRLETIWDLLCHDTATIEIGLRVLEVKALLLGIDTETSGLV
jgi:hypothetical protein